MSQRQCLPLDEDSSNSDQDFDMDNDSAAKYLKKVISQRNRIPQIVSVVAPMVIEREVEEKVTEEIQKDKDFKDPSIEWQDIQSNKFEQIQKKIIALRNNPKFQEIVEASHEFEITTDYCKTNEPKLSTVINLNQGYVEVLIEELMTNFTENIQDLNLQKFKEILWIPKWFYALFACLRLPLDPDVISNLRVIAKNCHNIINFLKLNQENPHDDLLPFNLIIGIVRQNFKQFDL